MSRQKNNWYVITGGPSTGKTTLLAELEKLGFATVPESARIVIDNALRTGTSVSELRSDELKFQIDILKHKIEVESNYPAEAVSFFDRGMHDTLAYLRLCNFKIGSSVLRAMEQATYKKVFLLEPLDRYEKDYARTETEDEALRLATLLEEAFSEYGMGSVKVPSMPLKERVKFILRHISETPTL